MPITSSSSTIPVPKGWEFLLPKDKVLRGAGYLRRSDPRKEANFSLGMQKDKIIEYCTTNNVYITDDFIFFDKYTGMEWRQRKGLQQLLEAARLRLVDVVIFYRLDRLSRDYIDQIVIQEQLKSYGVKIITLDPEEHADDDSPTGQIVRMVYSWQANIERNHIVEKCNDGRQKRAHNGHLITGNHALFGYDWIDWEETRDGEHFIVRKARYVINHEQALIVVEMFEMAANGVALHRIAYILTERGIKTPSGKDVWTHNTVKYILNHPYYKGDAAVFKKAQVHIRGEGTKRFMRPENEWVKLTEAVPAIVSEELWERVQLRIASNKALSPRSMKDPTKTLLRGRIYCGRCGGKMTVGSSVKNGIYYICQKLKNGMKGHFGCDNGTIAAHIADEKAWKEAQAVIINPQCLEEELAKRKTEDPAKEELEAFDRAAALLIPDIINLTTTIQTMRPCPAQTVLINRLDALEKQRLEIEDRKDRITRKRVNWQKAQQRIDEFKRWCEAHREQLASDSYEPTFEEKLTALFELGLIARVYRKDQEKELGYRMTIEFSPPTIMSALSLDRFIYLTGRNLR
jgi:site-specific DNA recombinase